MAMSMLGFAPSMAFPLLMALVCLVSMAYAEDTAMISPKPQLEPGEEQELMTIRLSVSGGLGNDAVYPILPLTVEMGANGTSRDRSIINFEGPLVAANESNYMNLTKPAMAYLCCDASEYPDDSMVDQNSIVNQLIRNQPRAIILYSTSGNVCRINNPSNLTFHTIFTMTNRDQALAALNMTTNTAGTVRALVTGNVTVTSDPGDGAVGNSSAVAMSILYSITGLITLLFLVIIGTGAVRAHRYPERYGPRSAANGRPRQSRAKGLARAVLDTIPIVKFGDLAMQSKLDPAIGLESQTARSSQDMSAEGRLCVLQGDPPSQTNSPPKSEEDAKKGTPANHSVSDGNNHQASGGHGHGPQEEEDHLGCSICTEDFTVGEDVRVLPCDHKFHPQCVDPWLTNVSGTCPLCRLDLRPQSEQPSASGASALLPPPLDVEHASGEDRGRESYHGSRRLPRLLDLPRLRHASVEERLEMLRRHVSQHHDSHSTVGDAEERSRRQRFADRLREKFRIRTRTEQPPPPPPSSGV